MSAPMDEDEESILLEDYYACLGVTKEASLDEINNAFRRLSRIYHPDKHLEEAMKEKAELMFTKIKKAHEVLADPHKRAIYDTMGMKGLETEGWEVVSRVKTPREIMEEYERLAEEREERRLQQRTNPRGTISVGVDATDFFDRYSGLDEDEYRSVFPSIEISSMSISQSVEAPLTTKDTAILAGSLGAQNGNGSGNIACTFRRVLSYLGWAERRPWVEVELAAGNGASLSLRGFRTLWRRGFGTMSGSLQLTPHGFRPMFNTMVATQLDKNLQGRLSWTAGAQSAMNTMVVWDNQRHHVAITFQLGIPTSFASLNYTHKFTEEDAKMRGAIKAGTFGMLLEYGFEKKISKFSVLGASVLLGVPVGVTMKIKLNRGNQSYLFPVHLSDTVLPSAVFYGTVVPLAAYFVLKILVINPFLKDKEKKDLEKKKMDNAEMLAKQKLEAEAALELMQETVERTRSAESRIGGLIITKAVYGKLARKEGETRPEETECIDVTAPLQAMVKDSKLLIPDGTLLSSVPGFYDPCYGEDKQLVVWYTFQGKQHRGEFEDKSKILLPKRDHCIEREDNSPQNHTTARPNQPVPH